MKLLVLLLALLAVACPRSWLAQGSSYLSAGVAWSERQLARIRVTHRCFARTLIWVIAVVVLLLLQCLFARGWLSILYIIMSSIVLALCIGPNVFSEFMARSIFRRKSEPVTVDGEAPKAKGKAHFVDGLVSFEADIFAPILWFLVFGVAGALAYRLWVLFASESETLETSETAASTEEKKSHWCRGILALINGITARLWILLLMLAGNFAGTFGIWWESLFHFQQSASALVKEASKAALGTEQNSHAADDLLDRSMILLLVVVAVLTITAWVS